MVEDLYLRHREELMRFARALGLSGGDREAEDLLQETFLRALAHQAKLKTLPDYQQRAWLYRVLRNLAHDARRRRRFTIPMPEDLEPAIDFRGYTEFEMRELLRALPPTLREVVYQRYWLGLNSKQIAEVAGIPDATIRYRLRSAIAILKSHFTDGVETARGDPRGDREATPRDATVKRPTRQSHMRQQTDMY